MRLRLGAFRPDMSILWKIVGIGVPSSVQMSLRSLTQLVLVIIVAGFGDPAVAAFGGGGRLQGIGLMTVFGISAASATLVGQNLGAGKPDRAARCAVVAMKMALVVMGCFATVTFIFAPQILSIYGSGPEVIEIGSTLLRTTAPALVFASDAIIHSRAVTGPGDTVPPMIISFIGLWAVQIPLAYVLSSVPSLGVTGVWWAGNAAGLVLMSMTGTYFLSGRWKRKKV